MQFYCDPEREQDANALPDAETFEVDAEGQHSFEGVHEYDNCDLGGGQQHEPGWYWQACFPGCLPDGPSFGAFDTEELAIADARESAGVA